jgi:hypothetical protein
LEVEEKVAQIENPKYSSAREEAKDFEAIPLKKALQKTGFL